MRSTATFDLLIAHAEGIDREPEIARLKKEIDRLKKDIQSKQDRLADQNFTKKAPQHVVDNLRATMVERQIEQQKLRAQLEQLEKSS